MTSSRKSVFVVLGFVLASLFTLVGPAQAAPAAVAQIDCGVRTSPGGAYLSVCDDLALAHGDYYGDVWGKVYGETFVQVRVVYWNNNVETLQADERPFFGFRITAAKSVTIRACNSNGCGAYS